MPHAEVAKMIAGSLHDLPHPVHNRLRLPWFSHFAMSQQPKDVQQQVHGHAQAIGEGIIELVERNGKSIVDTVELERLRAIAAVQQDSGGKVAHGFCAHCGTELIRLAVDDELNARVHRVAIESMEIPHKCWER